MVSISFANPFSRLLLSRVCSGAQLCPTPCDPMDCSPPGSSVHGILKARILEWVAIPFFRGLLQPRTQTCISWVSCISRYILYHWVKAMILKLLTLYIYRHFCFLKQAVSRKFLPLWNTRLWLTFKLFLQFWL